MSDELIRKCPDCGVTVLGPSEEGNEVRNCESCGCVYKVTETGTRLVARPDADRGNVGRRLLVFVALIVIAIVFFVMGLIQQ